MQQPLYHFVYGFRLFQIREEFVELIVLIEACISSVRIGLRPSPLITVFISFVAF